MYSEDMQDGFEQRVTQALERRTEVGVPVDFAARVASALPKARRRRASMPLGRRTAWAAAVVLTFALVALAPHAPPSFGNMAFDVELVVIAELSGIAYWLTVRRGV